MNDDERWTVDLTAAGRRISSAGVSVRRHLGLGPEREVWGAAYYDHPPTGRSEVTTDDLLASAALGVRITRESLESFERSRPRLNECLARLPDRLSLADADDDVLQDINTAVLESGIEPTVAAKLLHRVRPRLVPPYDRATTNWYSMGLGCREAGRPPLLFSHMRDDLAHETNRSALAQLQAIIAIDSDGALVPSQLRLHDIAIWMASRHTA